MSSTGIVIEIKSRVISERYVAYTVVLCSTGKLIKAAIVDVFTHPDFEGYGPHGNAN